MRLAVIISVGCGVGANVGIGVLSGFAVGADVVSGAAAIVPTGVIIVGDAVGGACIEAEHPVMKTTIRIKSRNILNNIGRMIGPSLHKVLAA